MRWHMISALVGAINAIRRDRFHTRLTSVYTYVCVGQHFLHDVVVVDVSRLLPPLVMALCLFIGFDLKKEERFEALRSTVFVFDFTLYKQR